MSMLRTYTTIAFAVPATLATSMARAQPSAVDTAATTNTDVPCVATTTHCHDGFYARFTLGLGYADLISDRAGANSMSSGLLSATVAVGGTPARGLVLGGVLGSDVAGAFQGVRLGGFADWYPSPEGGWHAGLAISAWLLVTAAGGENLTGVGPTATLSAGYDWWVRSQTSFGVFVSASGGSEEKMLDSNGNDSKYRFAPVDLLLGASMLFH